MEGLAEMTVLQYLHHVDKSVTLAINSLNCPLTDRIWMFFSDRLVWIPLYVIVAFFFFRNLGWKRGAIVFVSCVLTVLACDQFGNFVKDAVGRLRPCWDLDMVKGGLNILEDKGGMYGFYSAHAANALGFAICSVKGFGHDMTRKYKAYDICIVIWAVLVGLSRVFVGKHFFGDVCAGFIVGLAFGSLIAWAASKAVEGLGQER